MVLVSVLMCLCVVGVMDGLLCSVCEIVIVEMLVSVVICFIVMGLDFVVILFFV